jgi:dihydropteroate synthase
MHNQQPVTDIYANVSADFRRSTTLAIDRGVKPENIALDIGIGFGKTLEQNLELIARLDKLVAEFSQYPILVGTSRKSFIGKILGDVPVGERLAGSLATIAIAVWNGAKIVRVHDVKATADVVRVVSALSAEL